MRIHAVTPIHVDPTELARRRARYDRLAPAGLTVALHDVGPGAPRALETAQDVRDSEGAVLAALRAAPDDVDALLPDCVLDPGVGMHGWDGPPVLGLLRLTVGWSASQGRQVGAVARNQAIADELTTRVGHHGFSSWFTGTEVLDLDVEAISDHVRWDAALSTALTRMGRAGVSTVVNGCSAVDVAEQPGRARAVDPTAAALRLLAAGGLA